MQSEKDMSDVGMYTKKQLWLRLLSSEFFYAELLRLVSSGETACFRCEFYF